MNQEGRISTERQGHVLLIGLDRVAKRNAFDRAMLGTLGIAYAELEHDDQLRCGMLFAHGDHPSHSLPHSHTRPLASHRRTHLHS